MILLSTKTILVNSERRGVTRPFYPMPRSQINRRVKSKQEWQLTANVWLAVNLRAYVGKYIYVNIFPQSQNIPPQTTMDCKTSPYWIFPFSTPTTKQYCSGGSDTYGPGLVESSHVTATSAMMTSSVASTYYAN